MTVTVLLRSSQAHLAPPIVPIRPGVSPFTLALSHPVGPLPLPSIIHPFRVPFPVSRPCPSSNTRYRRPLFPPFTTGNTTDRPLTAYPPSHRTRPPYFAHIFSIFPIRLLPSSPNRPDRPFDLLSLLSHALSKALLVVPPAPFGCSIRLSDDFFLLSCSPVAAPQAPIWTTFRNLLTDWP
ncbi:hypothetical protein LX32DRAFT_184964 [Colletotrichum zoysiae]|uniref:Uncharacterized protein n=1 Tax=Colletotrichum zoysiae TaxID=1216348 RepID=A0AAD9H5P0_9PEZI|nr:hypothetical protein LX32DRAFT_184964 [Colletotrichum zoysiae]